MDKGSIAVIGNEDCILMFKILGCETFSPKGESETRSLLSKLLKKFKVIFIDEGYALFVSNLIESTKNSPYPIVLTIPSSPNLSSYSLSKIEECAYKALGTKLNF